MHPIDDCSIDRLANEPWYVSSRASQKDRFSRCLSLVEEITGAPAVIYDVGCADGQFSVRLAEKGATVTGLDIHPDRIAQNQARCSHIPGLTFRCEDFLTAAIPDGQADLVTALEVLYYFGSEDQRRFLEKAHRALRPGGRLLISANIFWTGHFSEESFAALLEGLFRIERTERIYRVVYYRLELPLIRILDQIRYLEQLRIFSPNILRLERRFYPGLWNALLLRPSKLTDTILIPGIRYLILKTLESKALYRAVTGLTKRFMPGKGRSQLIILAEKLP